LYQEIPKKLQEYHEKGYKLCILTNQGGIEKGHTQLSHIQKKIENIVELVS
jgi:Polynucleotide kinase 3 phosphatase.